MRPLAYPQPTPSGDDRLEGVESQSVSNSQSWLLGGFSLTALSVVLTRDAGSSLAMAAVGGVTLGVIGGLWWLWNREQANQPSPISEYLAVGYGWAFYAGLVFTWDAVGDRWVDWLIILPPVSFVPLIVRRLFATSSRRSVGSSRVAFVAHRLTAAVFIAAGAFLVLTVLAALIAPVPLIACAFHLVAGRFYARPPST